MGQEPLGREWHSHEDGAGASSSDWMEWCQIPSMSARPSSNSSGPTSSGRGGGGEGRLAGTTGLLRGIKGIILSISQLLKEFVLGPGQAVGAPGRAGGLADGHSRLEGQITLPFLLCVVAGKLGVKIV